MGPEMEIVVEETASVKEVSLDALQSLCHAWVRSAAHREPCFVPMCCFSLPGDVVSNEVFELALSFHQIVKRHHVSFK